MMSNINYRYMLLGLKQQGTVVNKFLSVKASVHSVLYNRSAHYVIPLEQIIRDDLSLYKTSLPIRKRSSSEIYHNKYSTIQYGNVLQKFPQCKNSTIFSKTRLFIHEHNTITNIKRFSSSYEPLQSSIVAYNSGVFKQISESTLVEFIQNSLTTIHSVTGLPWWATIILTTIVLRTTVSLPLSFYQLQNYAKLENLEPEKMKIMKRLQNETQYTIASAKKSVTEAKIMNRIAVHQEWMKLIIRENCHPVKGPILGIIQIPLWLCLLFALRNMSLMLPINNETAYITFLELTTGGFGWITNLADIDHTLVLPVVSGLCNLAGIEIQSMLIKEPRTLQKFKINVYRAYSIAIIPIGALLPSVVTLCWATSSVYGVFQALLLLSPQVRRLGRVPQTKSELQHPYAKLHDELKSRFIFKQKKFKTKRGIHD